MQDFRTLRVWQDAHALTIALLHASTRWHLGDLSGLVRQAALLMPVLLARGCNGTSVGLLTAIRNTRAQIDDLKALLTLARDLDELAACEYAAFDLRLARLTHQLESLKRTVRHYPEAMARN